ncbi:MAG: TolC family protein, partial [Phycisphaerales bacterium]
PPVLPLMQRPRHPIHLSALILMSALAGACQRYDAAPIDLTAHRAEFFDRAARATHLREFAANLAPSTFAPATPFDLADGVTCAEAEVVALVFSADLRLARLRAGVSAASAENAGLWADPTLGVDLTRIINGTPNPWKVFTSLGLTLPISGRLEVEKKRAAAEHAAELSRVAAAEWTARIAIRRAFTEWSALSLRSLTLRELLLAVDQTQSLVDRMEAAGETPRTEARLFRIEGAGRAAELAALESRTLEAELELKRLMGLAPDATITFVSAGIGPSPAEADSLGNASAISPTTPAMLTVMLEYESAEKALELAVKEQYPDLQIGPGYGREDGQDQFLLGINLPLPMFNGNRRAIAEATARRELARAEVETTLEQLESQSRAASLRIRAARAQREAFESRVVPLVDAQYADVRALAALGEVNARVMLETLSRLHDAKDRLIEARRDEALAHLNLRAILGPAPIVH